MTWIIRDTGEQDFYIKDKLIGSIIVNENGIIHVIMEFGETLDNDVDNAKFNIELSAYLIPNTPYSKH